PRFPAQHRVHLDISCEWPLYAKNLANAIESRERCEVQVVSAFGQRIETAIDEHAQIGTTVECDRLQLEHARRIAKLSAHVHVERHVVLNTNAKKRTAAGAGVEVFLRCDIHDCSKMIRIRSKVVTAIGEIKAAVLNEQLVNIEVVNFVARLRAGIPVREAVHQL